MDEKIRNSIDAFQEGVYIFNQHHSEISSNNHQHNKGQFEYAEGGIVNIYMEGKLWYLPARHFLWIPPNTPHRTLSQSHQLEFYTFYYNVENEDADWLRRPGVFAVDDLLREMILFANQWSGLIAPKGFPYQFMQSIFGVFQTKIRDLHSLPFQHPFPKDVRLMDISNYLNAHLNEVNSLSDIASHFGMSTRSLSRLFKESMGTSFVHYLQSLRITKAMELLVEKKLNINQISEIVGYESVPSFSNMFYKTLGVRPTEYPFKG